MLKQSYRGYYHKDSNSLIIELNDHSKAILEKYKDVPFPNDRALPVVNNQRMNEFLKELGQLAEIDEPIQKHIIEEMNE